MGIALHQMPAWPAAMDRDTALAYTGVAETQLRAWQRSGKVRFSPRGPSGALIALKVDLDTALRDLIAAGEDLIEFD